MSVTYSPQEKKRRVFGIIGAASGNLVEWFDFYIYAVFVVYFQKALTAPDLSDTAQSIYVWGIFAASFFMRPIGSWLFGWIADKIGRKQSMMSSISLMVISSFLFALLPTYEQVGAIAPFLLLLVRLMQGLSVGGEYGAVATYMSEVALQGKKGFYSSFQYVTLAGGQLLASMLGVLFLALMTQQQLENGGWRIPFIIGGVVGLISLFTRSKLEETLTEEHKNNKESGSMRSLFRDHWRAFITVVGYTAGGSLAFYTITIYSKTYMTNLGVSAKTVGYIMTIALFVFMVAQPLFGIIGDKLGRRANMLLFSSLLAIFIYPIMVIAMPLSIGSPVILTLLVISLMLILSFYTSIGGLVKAEMFPAELRALGVGFSYALGNALFGGTAPAVALQFKNAGIQNEFFIYVVIMLIICFFFSWRIPKKANYLQEH